MMVMWILIFLGSVPVWMFGLSWWLVAGHRGIESTIASENDPNLASPVRAWILGNLAAIVSLTYRYDVHNGGCLVCGGEWWGGWPLPWLGVYGFTGMFQLFTLPANIVFWFLVSWFLLWCARLVLKLPRVPRLVAPIVCVLIPCTAALPAIVLAIRGETPMI
jgi:hypothetical protein